MYFGYICKNCLARPWGRLISSYLGNHHTDFHSGWRRLHSHQQWISVTFPYVTESTCFILLILVILTGIRWNLKVFLICISLVTKDDKQVFKGFSAIFVSFFFSKELSSVLSSLSHFWQRPLRKEGWKECQRHRWGMTTRTQCYLDRAGQLHTWTHRGWEHR